MLTLSSAATRKQVEAVRSGCVVDGAAVRPVSVARLDPSLDGGSLHRLVVVVADGRNREVRALAESAGLGEVLTGLKRTRVGGLRLWPGPAGGVRELSAKEAREVLGGEGAGG